MTIKRDTLTASFKTVDVGQIFRIGLGLVGIGLFLFLGARLWSAATAPDEYEQLILDASKAKTAWARYEALAGHVSPNAWVWHPAHGRIGQSEQTWRDAAQQALEDALKSQDGAATDYVCREYGTYESLRPLRETYCSKG